MTWIACLQAGPLDGERIRVPNQEEAFAFPFGAQLAVYACLRSLDGFLVSRRAGELALVFECVREMSEREASLFGLVILEVAAA